MFDDVLLSDVDLRVYRSMLRVPDINDAERAESLSLNVQDLVNAVERLVACEMVDRVGETQIAVTPVLAVSRLAALEQARSTNRSAWLGELISSIPELVLDHQLGGVRSRRTVEFESVGGTAGALDAVDELTAACTTQVCALSNLTGPNRPERDERAGDRNLAATRSAIARGVKYRTIASAQERDTPYILEQHLRYAASGELVRFIPGTMPPHTVIFDSRVAMVPIDPLDVTVGAVIVRAEGIVATLQAFFERTWLEAVPLILANDGGPALRRRRILRLLASGARDESVARSLGVGLRTVRREIADLLAELGAESRFHAGVLAHSRGWLDHLDS